MCEGDIQVSVCKHGSAIYIYQNNQFVYTQMKSVHSSVVSEDDDVVLQGESGKVSGSPVADLTPCLQALDLHLSESSYIVGHVPTQADSVAHQRIGSAGCGALTQNYLHFTRWWRHIESFGSDSKGFPSTDLTVLSQFSLLDAYLPQVNICFYMCSHSDYVLFSSMAVYRQF